MSSIYYEQHVHKDPDFPIIFHYDRVNGKSSELWTHWHESLEILYITEGSAMVFCNGYYISAEKGDVVIINSDSMHHVKSRGEETGYYCLIVDKQVCAEFGLCIEKVCFENKVTSQCVVQMFERVSNELFLKQSMYKAAAKSAITDLLIYLYRNYVASQSSLSYQNENIKIETVKQSIRYIRENWNKKISTADISKNIGLSKFYFCRIFKEITGQTPVSYINLLKCLTAKKILQSGRHTISEVALLSGFYNMSYFTRTYNKYIGCNPSVSIDEN